MTLLRKMSEGDVGSRPRQVIVTTHSPMLLGYAKPEEVRIFRRDLERGTEVFPMSTVPDLERLQHALPPGDLWHLLTEGAMPCD
jgi:predicted ATP-dependent endonuclease of OLD family